MEHSAKSWRGTRPDKSAVATINRALLSLGGGGRDQWSPTDGRMNLSRCIIGGGRDQSGPTGSGDLANALLRCSVPFLLLALPGAARRDRPPVNTASSGALCCSPPG